MMTYIDNILSSESGKYDEFVKLEKLMDKRHSLLHIILEKISINF